MLHGSGYTFSREFSTFQITGLQWIILCKVLLSLLWQEKYKRSIYYHVSIINAYFVNGFYKCSSVCSVQTYHWRSSNSGRAVQGSSVSPPAGHCGNYQ